MNKQGPNGIEWTDYTWNPVAGCQHGCRWNMPDGSTAICYAEAVANKVAQAAYPHGFEHHYWNPARLNEPLSVRKPSRIFLDSMSDLMGYWVSDDQITAVLDICRQAHWHTFQLLTKNARRLPKFSYPPNVWVGVSAPPSVMFGKPLTANQRRRFIQTAMQAIDETDAAVAWMSIEPLSYDMHNDLWDAKAFQCLDWLVIGAASNGPRTYQPEPQWVIDILDAADCCEVPVFFKGNLRGNPAATPWRAEFPVPQEVR